MSDKGFIYSDRDLAAVLHYMHFGNMTNAYKHSMFGNYKGSIKNASLMASRYFNSDKIRALLVIESQKFEYSIDSIYERCGMKKPESKNINSLNKQLENIENLDKKEAENLLNELINANKSDPKIVKDLMAQLITLNSWKVDKEVNNSNIIRYEIPKKLNTY